MPRIISLSGHGEVRATPDIAYVTSGVLTQGATAAEARRGDEEGAGGLDLLVEGPHRRVEELDAPAQRLAPAGEVHRRHLGFRIESRQPVEALHRAAGAPLSQARGELVRRRGAGEPPLQSTPTA